MSLRDRSGRSIVGVKKNRSADTMLFIAGAGTPASRCSTWNRRTSSAVAVSGSDRGRWQSVRQRAGSCAGSLAEKPRMVMSSITAGAAD